MGAPALQISAADDPWAFQTDLVHQIEAALGNHASVLLQLPTGGGKTHVAAAVIRRWNARRKRVWFVCHTRELIRQTCAKLDALGVSHGIVSPEYEPCYERRVQVCSVDTLRNRIEKLGDLLQDPDLIVWDECQHVAAPSWSAIKARYAGARHLGLTATPERLDGTGLGQWFDHLICGPTTRDLIVRGRISRYRLFAPTIPDLRGVKTLAGDYAARDLDDRMGGSVLVGDVVEHYRKLAPGARAIVFAVSVKHSKAVVERFQAAGIPAVHVDGTTRKDDRDAAVERLASSEIKVLSNVRVFTEGFDVPAIDAVIVLRPTKSRALFLQMIGRGLRKADGKAATIVLDHAGVVYEHGLPDDDYEWTLEGHASRGAKKPLGGRLRRCPDCNAVHEWAAECVECGHVYAQGERTIDEVYGELREVGAGAHRYAPRGAHTAFARRIGRSPDFVRRLVKRGLPVRPDGFIDDAAALAWCEQHPEYMSGNYNAPPRGSGMGEYCSTSAFGIKVGRSGTVVQRLKQKGLPHADNGWIHVEKGLEWMAEYESQNKTKLSSEYETVSRFARRIGITNMSVYAWCRKGILRTHDGYVHIKDGLDWFKSYKLDGGAKNTRKPPPGSAPGEYVTLTDFGEMTGLTLSQLRRHIKLGLPRADNGWVHVEKGIKLVAEGNGCVTPSEFARRLGIDCSKVYRYIKENGMPTRDGRIKFEEAIAWYSEYTGAGLYESRAAFARRVGAAKATVSKWAQLGLPLNKRGWIHVEKGLAWYEEYKARQRK